jgi:hypothetical protein
LSPCVGAGAAAGVLWAKAAEAASRRQGRLANRRVGFIEKGSLSLTWIEWDPRTDGLVYSITPK